ncbi:hypothetical protein DL93DRAFT_2090253 [Clavulina sp. PMI_390]|nr:hypothetical protein DL93DRAFT_2090253 [Clavulina sp. PMI_390]
MAMNGNTTSSSPTIPLIPGAVIPGMPQSTGVAGLLGPPPSKEPSDFSSSNVSSNMSRSPSRSPRDRSRTVSQSSVSFTPSRQ